MFSFLRRFFTNLEQAHLADHGDEPLVDPADALETVETSLEVGPDGWLTSPNKHVLVQRFPTVRTSKLAPNLKGPRRVVWHWTATAENTIVGIAKRAQTFVKGKDREASFHLGIPRRSAQGVVQLAPFTVGTWHAGGEKAARFTSDGRMGGTYSANRISAGVELENVGEVRLVNGKWRAWPFKEDTKLVIPVTEVATVGSKYYQDFTGHQIEMATEYARAMVAAYGLKRDDFMLGHVDIDPTRKSDPGPLWEIILERYVLPEVFGS